MTAYRLTYEDSMLNDSSVFLLFKMTFSILTSLTESEKLRKKL